MTIKRSLSIRGHHTSVSIENEFWAALQDVSKRDNRSVAALVAEIDAARTVEINLSSAIRLFVLRDLQAQLADRSPNEASERIGGR